MKKILLTCPPMINRISEYNNLIEKYNFQIEIPEFKQIMQDIEDDVLPFGFIDDGVVDTPSPVDPAKFGWAISDTWDMK